MAPARKCINCRQTASDMKAADAAKWGGVDICPACARKAAAILTRPTNPVKGKGRCGACGVATAPDVKVCTNCRDAGHEPLELF